MTLTTAVTGYLETEYLSDPYATGLAQGSGGIQANIIIEAQTAYGLQVKVQIVDRQDGYGIQALVLIPDTTNGKGVQARVTIEAQYKNVGLQLLGTIVDFLEEKGVQSKVNILDYVKTGGIQARIDKFPNSVCNDATGYLSYDYLIEPYLTEIWCSRFGVQAEILNNYLEPLGIQANVRIADYLKTQGVQARVVIADALKPIGHQATIVKQSAVGIQVLNTIYNTTNLRILCDFPSRGLTNSNWTANSTATGDFSVQNLDTDVTEQKWRSNNVTSGVSLITDTGLTQGVFLDTLAILGHNLTRSANVTLLGSNDPSFTTIGITIPLEARLNNIFYIAPTLPNAGYRYWKFNIDDATNSQAYLEIGTIIFGASKIFQGECFLDRIELELKDFSDTIRTLGFSNVTNSRTQKRRVKLEFQSLSFQKRNFNILRDIFERDRTVNKCLWIPTPNETLQDVTARFAVYGKLATIPTESHNNKGPDQDYVSFTVDVDESL